MVVETREQLLRRLMSSPQELKALSLHQRITLQKKLTAALNGDQVLKCVYGPYQGDGIPPECIKRVPLTSQERDRELKRIDLMFKSQRNFIEQHASAMHAQLLHIFPTSCLTQAR